MALQLRKFGIRHVRPLLGGFYEWKELGFPLVEIAPPGQEAAVSAGQIGPSDAVAKQGVPGHQLAFRWNPQADAALRVAGRMQHVKLGLAEL